MLGAGTSPGSRDPIGSGSVQKNFLGFYVFDEQEEFFFFLLLFVPPLSSAT
jgi:hypothetical protein